MAKTNPIQFLREVNLERRKVVWPTRKETAVTTAMVFAMVVAAALFFLAVDAILGRTVRWILGLGG